MARHELDVARKHHESAETILESDPAGAFQIGYDAMRKSISAHMRARGYRAAKQGAHVKTGLYAHAALDGVDIQDHLDAFDELRQTRHQSEYDALELESEEVSDLLMHAQAFVEAIAADLGFS